MVEPTKQLEEDARCEYVLRGCQLEALEVLQTFGWLLSRYRDLSDPISYRTAHNIYSRLKGEALEVTTRREAEVCLDTTRSLLRSKIAWHFLPRSRRLASRVST